MFVIIYSARQIQPSMDTIANFLYFTLTLYSVVILIFLDKLKQHNFQKKNYKVLIESQQINMSSWSSWTEIESN
jgi:sugar diacid utilization regulator